MKLYLSSYRIPTPDELFKLIGKKPAEIKVAIIPNAMDYYSDRAKKFKVNDTVAYMQSLGLQVVVEDLKNYCGPEQLASALRDYGLIWSQGGNTFCLRYEMKRSGFDNCIKDLLDRGVVYGGDSAGAMVAGNSLRGAESADEPAFAEEVIWEGLNLTDKFILPHIGSAGLGDAIEKVRILHENDETVVQLSDAQALIVDGDKVTIVSSEVK